MRTRHLLLGWMVTDARTRLPAAALVLAVRAIASGQSLVEPDRVATLQTAFDSAAAAPQLRCQISAVRPVLDYALRFRTGYVIDFPMVQFHGSGHHLSTFLRVTAEGLKPVWLESTGNLPEVPATRIDGQIQGTFVVGEGTYDVDAFVQDDAHRVCHTKWRIQAKRSGSERELAAATPASTVEELIASNPGSGAPQPPAPGIGRLTLMLHAAPASPRASKLQDSDISTLVGSLLSLLQQLPAKSVRLVVFNLAQRAVLYRQDGFTAKDLEKVITAFNHLQLALVDYRKLQQHGGPDALLADLVQTELRDPRPADALILFGPRLQTGDIPVPAVDKPSPASTSLFYLQYQPQLPLFGGQASIQGRRGGRGMPGDPGDLGAAAPMPPGTSDSIEKLLARLKGKTIAIRTPHEFADALWHIQEGIGKPGMPAEQAAATTAAQSNPPESPKAPEAADGRPDMPPLPKFTTPAEAPGDVDPAPPKAPAGRVTDQSPGQGPLNLPKLEKLPEGDPSTSDADPVEVLMRLRDRVLKNGARIPNYTCVETIQRDRYEPVTGRANQSCDTVLARRRQAGFPLRLRLDTSDRLRLDVAMTSDREIYSWAGASKFEEGEIDELVPTGAMGTGPFAAHLLSVFEKTDPKFVYEGDVRLGGRSLIEYSYSVPLEESHYRVKAHKEWVVTAYTGTLLVDPKTSELVRLTVRTAELPPAAGECESDTGLEYGTVQLGGDDYILPKVTHQRFIGRDGSESENTVTFSACREYHAESKLTFGKGAGASEGAPTSPPPGVDLPPGLPVNIDLTEALDGAQAAAGDRIQGRLAKPIRDARQKILVPEGAVIHGRLMRVETRHSTPLQFTVALRWESLEINGVKLPFSLLPDRRPGTAGLTPLGGLRKRGMVIELPQPGEAAFGVYHFRVEGVESGFRTEWLTARP